MIPVRSSVLAGLAAATACCAAACFAVTDLDRFHEAPPAPAADAAGGGPSDSDGGGQGHPAEVPRGSVGSPCAHPADVAMRPFMDFDFKFLNATSHIGKQFEFRIVDDATNVLKVRGVVDALKKDPDILLCVPQALPIAGGPYRLDYWAQLGNLSRDYVGLGDALDHSWRLDPLLARGADNGVHDEYTDEQVLGGVLSLTYSHSHLFTDISMFGDAGAPSDTGSLAIIHLDNMSLFMGHEVEVRIREKGSGHTVGLYRYPSLPQPDNIALLRGVVERDIAYNVDVYIDQNGNGLYDDPSAPGGGGGGDLGFRLETTSDPASGGFEVSLDPVARMDGNVDVGPP
jgi:hypothetical protein